MYKSRLQELCHRRQWALPRYTSMKDGPDHNPCFKASVYLNGMSFHSSVSCKSCKEAQNDAAKSAFLHFGSSSSYHGATPNPAQEVDLGFYKNLLQELSRREEFSIPEYKTMKCGLPHRPTFFSSVEVEGEVFYGKGAKSKKEAEINAAKIAYTNLTERLPVKSSELSSPEFLASGPLKPLSTSVLATTVENEEHAEESKYDTFLNFILFILSTALAQKCILNRGFFCLVDEVQEVKAGGKALAINATTSPDISSSCSKAVPISLKEGSLSSTSTDLDISALSISDSSMGKETGLRSYLLNNRFRVYPSFPDIAFPEGITVLPISEDKWVAVSLEFPNERDA
ncbi:hypothetical protein REPUB_Repub11eG0121600 [Reevesia pubescens]